MNFHLFDSHLCSPLSVPNPETSSYVCGSRRFPPDVIISALLEGPDGVCSENVETDAYFTKIFFHHTNTSCCFLRVDLKAKPGNNDQHLQMLGRLIILWEHGRKSLSVHPIHCPQTRRKKKKEVLSVLLCVLAKDETQSYIFITCLGTLMVCVSPTSNGLLRTRCRNCHFC